MLIASSQIQWTTDVTKSLITSKERADKSALKNMKKKQVQPSCCFMTLTTALHLHRGGSPKGPAGTGKTESVKDLGKALGMYVIVVNCSEGLDFKSMGRMYSGLAQTGAWGCFDEFNRINIEVLGHFYKGYAGRTELPDNLKSMFRPISMVVPDSTLIAEIILFGEGFNNCKILLMSMKDMNIAKLTSMDLPLFTAIVQDLFPGVDTPIIDYGKLRETIEAELKTSGLQATPFTMAKVIQLYETKNSRHSTVIVGKTCSGKSVTWRTLQSAMNALYKKGEPGYCLVRDCPLNPKALSLGELYGEYDLTTNEWTDGVLSSLMRTACAGFCAVVQEEAEPLQRLFDKFIHKTMEFKKANCRELVPIAEFNGVVSLCKLYEALATLENGVNPSDSENYSRMVELWFTFSMIWSVCAAVDEDGRKKIDNFLREMEGTFPNKVRMNHVSESCPCNTSCAPFYKIMVPTVDTVRYNFLVSSLVSNQCPVLLVGPVGTGKTSVAQNALQSLDSSKWSVLTVNMSAQPPLELVRLWIDYGFWYDRQKQTVKYVKDMFLMAAMGPPGGGRTHISGRLQSRFNLINMTFPTESQIKRIYGAMINQKLQEFEEEVKPIGNVVTQATLEIYNAIVQKFLPTPAKIHYLFNLRDISKVFQGMLRAHRDFHDTKHSITRLWIHECLRCSRACCGLTETSTIPNTASHGSGYMSASGDFIREPRVYEDLVDFKALKQFMETQLGDYNITPGVVPMSLVLFRDAIEHSQYQQLIH
ncbi:UNVERIFIED_CONTAM: hypothetical protein FKN15_029966 [Acipenser sinensis]